MKISLQRVAMVGAMAALVATAVAPMANAATTMTKTSTKVMTKTMVKKPAAPKKMGWNQTPEYKTAWTAYEKQLKDARVALMAARKAAGKDKSAWKAADATYKAAVAAAKADWQKWVKDYKATWSSGSHSNADTSASGDKW